MAINWLAACGKTKPIYSFGVQRSELFGGLRAEVLEFEEESVLAADAVKGVDAEVLLYDIVFRQQTEIDQAVASREHYLREKRPGSRSYSNLVGFIVAGSLVRLCSLSQRGP